MSFLLDDCIIDRATTHFFLLLIYSWLKFKWPQQFLISSIFFLVWNRKTCARIGCDIYKTPYHMENRYADLNITALPVSTTHNDTLVSNDTASTTTSLTIQNGTVSTQTNYANNNNSHTNNNNNSHHMNNNHISSNGTAGRIKPTDDQVTPNNLVVDEQNSTG